MFLKLSFSMSPGKWKLVGLSLGRTFQKDLTIPDDVTFEISQISPVVIHVQAPSRVQAGQPFSIKINLDKYPESQEQGCVLALSALFKDFVPPEQRANSYSFPANSVDINENQHSYEISGILNPDVPTGQWMGDVLLSAHPNMEKINQPIQPPRHRCTFSPKLEGNTHFAFSVEPSPHLVTPTSVAVTVNPSQIQLLLGEFDRLKAKAEDLEEQLSSTRAAADQSLLQTSLKEALEDLDRTEAAYKEKGVDQLSSRAVNVFFDDIRLNYGEALKAIASSSAQSHPACPQLERVSTNPSGPLHQVGQASEAVLKSIRQNARAYYVAASSGTMTFDLDVSSDPEGATVSYRQRTDPEYQQLDHKTDWRIQNMYRAHYFIRFQMPGYEDQVVDFNGADSTDASIHVPLVHKGSRR